VQASTDQYYGTMTLTLNQRGLGGAVIDYEPDGV
jgi:hypothetical protein